MQTLPLISTTIIIPTTSHTASNSRTNPTSHTDSATSLVPTLPLTDAGAGADDEHGEVRRVAGQAEDGRLQVLVVSAEVNECDQLRGRLADVLGGPLVAVVHQLTDNTT